MYFGLFCNCSVNSPSYNCNIFTESRIRSVVFFLVRLILANIIGNISLNYPGLHVKGGLRL